MKPFIVSSGSAERLSIGDCVAYGLLMAVGVCIMAIVGLLIFFVAWLAGTPTEPFTLGEIAIGVPLIFLSYFLAGIVGALAVWMVQPLLRWMLGWFLLGAILAVVVYGMVAATGIFAYGVFGINMLGLSPPEEAAVLLPKFLLVAAGLGFFLWGPIIWWQFGRERAR